MRLTEAGRGPDVYGMDWLGLRLGGAWLVSGRVWNGQVLARKCVVRLAAGVR